MKLEDRAISDIRAQRDALVADFEAWRLRVAPDGALRQHGSQVVRVTDLLTETLKVALDGTVLVSQGEAMLGSIEAPRVAVEVLHLIWDFFRDKLSQRDSPRYASHLGAADDLALDCYLPFVAARVSTVATGNAVAGEALFGKLKEPPLVSYSPERGLFAQSRRAGFVPQGLDAVDVDRFRAALQRLPVPIITMPWSHASRAPALVFVAHEAGHVVADDLELDGEIERKLDAVDLPAERAARWKKWLPEVFADLFATATLGTAYVDALAAFLAGPLNVIRAEEVKDGDYPTRAIRLGLCCKALEALGIAPYSQWEDAYGSASPADYVADAAKVAATLLDGGFPELGGKSVRGVLAWSKDEETIAATAAGKLLDQHASPSASLTARQWIAAAAIAHRLDPVRYQAHRVDERTLAAIAAERGAEARSAGIEALRARLPIPEDEGLEGVEDELWRGRELAAILGLVRN